MFRVTRHGPAGLTRQWLPTLDEAIAMIAIWNAEPKTDYCTLAKLP